MNVNSLSTNTSLLVPHLESFTFISHKFCFHLLMIHLYLLMYSCVTGPVWAMFLYENCLFIRERSVFCNSNLYGE